MQCCLSRSLCPGVPRDCRRGAMLVQGVEGVVTRGECNRQGFVEDVNCVGGTVAGGKFNKFCCVSYYCAIGVGIFCMGWCSSDPASNGEARGGQQVCDSRWVGCLLILGGSSVAMRPECVWCVRRNAH
jgi:hypothetical protein